MNPQILKLARKSGATVNQGFDGTKNFVYGITMSPEELDKFAQLIVREVCGMMGQAEDDAYHCFEPSERPTEYIEWLRDWQERFTKHFGVEE